LKNKINRTGLLFKIALLFLVLTLAIPVAITLVIPFSPVIGHIAAITAFTLFFITCCFYAVASYRTIKMLKPNWELLQEKNNEN
jgi:hypothetical protein